MRKKCFLFLLLLVILLNAFACKPKEQESEGESKSEVEMREPEIFRCRVSADLESDQKVDQGIHLLGKMFLDSRTGTKTTAEEKLEKYGYCLESYWDFGVGRVFVPGSAPAKTDEDVQSMEIQADGNTWIIAYSAQISRWGTSDPSWSGPKFDGSNWTFGDWWILHREAENVFSMMSYTDYQHIKENRKEYAENPFAAYPVETGDIPEAGYWKYEAEKDFILNSGFRSDTVYYEPLQAHLYESSIVYEYEADTEEVTEEGLQKAALELGKMYLEELCSREYDPWMKGKFVRNVREYYVKEYKDLEIYSLENSLDRTVEKLAEQTEDPEGFKAYYSNIPSDCFMAAEDWSPYNVVLKAADNIWVADYQFLVKSDDPVWGRALDENNQELSVGEGFKPSTDAGLSHGQVALIVKQGKKYSMVMSPEIVKESDIGYE